MPACFLRHTISNETLECRFRVHINVILKIQTESKKSLCLRKSSPVQACRPLQANCNKTFKNFQNQRGAMSATMHVKISRWSTFNFQDLPKNQNPTSTKYIIIFSCSEDVKLSYQRQSFCQF